MRFKVGAKVLVKPNLQSGVIVQRFKVGWRVRYLIAYDVPYPCWEGADPDDWAAFVMTGAKYLLLAKHHAKLKL